MSLATRGKRAFSYILLAILLFIGDILAYSRGAWLGTLVGLLVLAGLAIAKPGWANIRPQRVVLVLTLACATGALILVFVPSVYDVLLGRGANLLNAQQGTGLGRLADWNLLITDGLKQPILGHGADAYKALLLPGLVVESASVEIFHSAGILGLGLYAMAYLLVVARLIRGVFGSRPESADRAMPAVALASFVALFVSSQLNPSMWGNMYWLLLAICLAASTSAGQSATTRSRHFPLMDAVHAKASS
jgi:hypothetical protein